MKSFIVASVLLVAVSAALLEDPAAQFQAFKLKHNKSYKNQVEEATRFAIFQKRVQEFEEHNAFYEQGLVTYKKGVNKFTDWTDDERKAYRTLHPKPDTSALNKTMYVKQNIGVPDSVDLRELGYVTPIKDQGQCGSCWSFAVVGGIEGGVVRQTGKLVSLAEQQLIDCSTDVNFGCDGGYIEQTYPYIEQNGLEATSDYPYEAVDGSCRYDANKVVSGTKFSGYTMIPQGDESALLEAVYAHGPISAAIDSTLIMDYASGIFNDPGCTTNCDHGVVIVGYGSENGVDYWIVRNSWGTVWGEDGYMRLVRGSNHCGITQDDCYPTY